jgi:hypothetical protein
VAVGIPIALSARPALVGLVLLVGCAELPKQIGGGPEGPRLRLVLKGSLQKEEVPLVWARGASKAAAGLRCSRWTGEPDTWTVQREVMGTDDEGNPVHPTEVSGPWQCVKEPERTDETTEAAGAGASP